MTISRAERERRAAEVLAVTSFMSTTAQPMPGCRLTITRWHKAFTDAGLINHPITVSRFSRIVNSLGYHRGRAINGTVIMDYRITGEGT